MSAGINFNNLSLDSADEVESNVASGYNLGLSYKRGRFFTMKLVQDITISLLRSPMFQIQMRPIKQIVHFRYLP